MSKDLEIIRTPYVEESADVSGGATAFGGGAGYLPENVLPSDGEGVDYEVTAPNGAKETWVGAGEAPRPDAETLLHHELVKLQTAHRLMRMQARYGELRRRSKAKVRKARKKTRLEKDSRKRNR